LDVFVFFPAKLLQPIGRLVLLNYDFASNAATRLRYGGIFSDRIIADLRPKVPAEEF